MNSSITGRLECYFKGLKVVYPDLAQKPGWAGRQRVLFLFHTARVFLVFSSALVAAGFVFELLRGQDWGTGARPELVLFDRYLVRFLFCHRATLYVVETESRTLSRELPWLAASCYALPP